MINLTGHHISLITIFGVSVWISGRMRLRQVLQKIEQNISRRPIHRPLLPRSEFSSSLAARRVNTFQRLNYSVTSKSRTHPLVWVCRVEFRICIHQENLTTNRNFTFYCLHRTYTIFRRRRWSTNCNYHVRGR